MRGEPEPGELLEDSQEAYFSALPAGGGGPIYLALLGVLCATAVTLPLVSVDVTTRARGILRPEVEQHHVAAGTAGVVERVGGRLGDRVRPGDLLLGLRSDALAAAVAANDSAAAAARTRAEELTALLEVAAALADGTGASRGATSAPPGAPASARFRHERAALLDEWTSAGAAVAPALAEAERTRSLAARALAPPAQEERTRLVLEQARAAPRQLAARQRDAWAAELASVRETAGRLAAERARLDAEALLAQVRAPVAGTVESLISLSPGSWVAAGQEIAVISPDAPLAAEVYVDSREVGRIRRGMPVRLLVDAFDHHEWGALPAVVADVAGDARVLGERALFRVRCRPLVRALTRPGGGVARPGKGMAVTASFTLGRRTLLRLLFQRVASVVDDPPPAPATR